MSAGMDKCARFLAINTGTVLMVSAPPQPDDPKDGTANTDRFRTYNPDTVEEMLGQLDKLVGAACYSRYVLNQAAQVLARQIPASASSSAVDPAAERT